MNSMGENISEIRVRIATDGTLIQGIGKVQAAKNSKTAARSRETRPRNGHSGTLTSCALMQEGRTNTKAQLRHKKGRHGSKRGRNRP